MTPENRAHMLVAHHLRAAANLTAHHSEAALYRLLAQHHYAMQFAFRTEADARRLDALTDLAEEVQSDLQDEVVPEPEADPIAQEAEFTRRNAAAIFGSQ